jgi:LysR family transcriptional regulator, transcriptional activator of nhaA
MDWLNYHHLLYFWTVAKEGSISRACEPLGLTEPTISSQIKRLEQRLGAKLFRRRGRNLVLTETGKVAFDYAEEIFGLGRELLDVLAGRRGDRPLRFTVGLPDALPKLVVYRILEPVAALPEPVQLVCVEGKLDALFTDLAEHRLDLLIADTPLGPPIAARAFNHLLGECSITVFGVAALAKQFAGRFPRSLDEAPMLLPTSNTVLRRSLDQWFDSENIRPKIVGEFEDSALQKTFGQKGMGMFAAPSVVEKEICEQFGVKRIGRLESVKQRFYVISLERRIKHPAVAEITQHARQSLFRGI